MSFIDRESAIDATDELKRKEFEEHEISQLCQRYVRVRFCKNHATFHHPRRFKRYLYFSLNVRQYLALGIEINAFCNVDFSEIYLICGLHHIQQNFTRTMATSITVGGSP